jgi:hypothetical protein
MFVSFFIDRQGYLSLSFARRVFFSEEDDVDERRLGYNDHNLKVNELTYRRIDIADLVSAQICAMNKAPELRWGKYIISAPPPFSKDAYTLRQLDYNAKEAIKQVVPWYEQVYAKQGWIFLDRIDRVYDPSKAIHELGWCPVYTFQRALSQIAKGEEWRSSLTLQVGMKGYHAEPTGIYTTTTCYELMKMPSRYSYSKSRPSQPENSITETWVKIYQYQLERVLNYSKNLP